MTAQVCSRYKLLQKMFLSQQAAFQLKGFFSQPSLGINVNVGFQQCPNMPCSSLSPSYHCVLNPHSSRGLHMLCIR